MPPALLICLWPKCDEEVDLMERVLAMKQLPALIRREFWEHRASFLMLPLVMTGLLALLILWVTVHGTSIRFTLEGLLVEPESSVSVAPNGPSTRPLNTPLPDFDLMHESARVVAPRNLMSWHAPPFMLVLWLVIVFYLLGSLYNERRDRSILFWKSMPVSDCLTVMAKLIVGVVIVPLVYLACVIALQLLLLLLITLDTSPGDWFTVWGEVVRPLAWQWSIPGLLVYALGCLPLYGWLLVVSGFARGVPLVWAIGVPLTLIIVEYVFTGQGYVATWLSAHMLETWSLQRGDQGKDLAEVALSLDMLSALVTGVGLIVLAIWSRRHADEL